MENTAGPLGEKNFILIKLEYGSLPFRVHYIMVLRELFLVSDYK
jgi:hypothetical protein